MIDCLSSRAELIFSTWSMISRIWDLVSTIIWSQYWICSERWLVSSDFSACSKFSKRRFYLCWRRPACFSLTAVIDERRSLIYCKSLWVFSDCEFISVTKSWSLQVQLTWVLSNLSWNSVHYLSRLYSYLLSSSIFLSYPAFLTMSFESLSFLSSPFLIATSSFCLDTSILSFLLSMSISLALSAYSLICLFKVVVMYFSLSWSIAILFSDWEDFWEKYLWRYESW